MNRTSLLIVIVTIALWSHGAIADDSIVASSTTVAAEMTATDSYEVPVAEPSSAATSTFDYSYLLVLAIGLAGLVWIRRQTQSL